MVVHPLESAGTRKRSIRSALPSIALHAALIFLAVRATASAAIAHDAPAHRPDIVYYDPVPPARRPAPASPTRRVDAPPDARRFDPTQFHAPAIHEGPTPAISVGPTLDTPPAGDFGHDALTSPAPFGGTRTGAPGSDVMRGDQVDRPVEALGSGAVPAYPEALRSRAVSGTVVAEFVVDTTGRVEPGSFRAIRSDDPLFTEAVRVALIRARFRPAEVAGTRVRQLVQQPFTFVLR
jgi:protein TonB